MFRRPDDDDDDNNRKVVKAKPISERYAKALGITTGKDFVSGSKRSQDEFYGAQQVNLSDEPVPGTPLTGDERNKISAKILKAEMKGDKDLVRKLKAKLEGGVSTSSSSSSSDNEKTVVLMKRDRAGNILPAISKKNDLDKHAQSSSRMQREYGKRQDVDEMVREEKTATSRDQLAMFEDQLVKSAKIRRHDDESVDDIAEMQKGKRKRDEKDVRRHEKDARKEHRRLERSLDDCARCLDSKKFSKHAVVAIGVHTYLSVVEWDGLDGEHSILAPTQHTSSTIQLDENVWDEIRIWRKGLTAMWKEQGRDCVFLEMSRNVDTNPHVTVECIPLPDEIGEMAPIYFNKAIQECESEWADNKKLIETKDLRKQIPKGFSYMAIDFGLQNGYAHVIENADYFPQHFATEILVGMLDLPASKWRKRETQSFEVVKQKRDDMREQWKPFDWTRRIPGRDSDE